MPVTAEKITEYEGKALQLIDAAFQHGSPQLNEITAGAHLLIAVLIAKVLEKP